MIILAFSISFICVWCFNTNSLSAWWSLLSLKYTFTWTIWSCEIWTNCFISFCYTITSLSIIYTTFSICYTHRKLCPILSFNKIIAFDISSWSNIICAFLNLIKACCLLSCWTTPTFNCSIITIKIRAFRLSTFITRATSNFRDTKISCCIITLIVYLTRWCLNSNISCTLINSI